MIIKILGAGCANCKRTKELARQVIDELKLEAQVEEVTDIADIIKYGVMSTPAVVINDQVAGAGGVPSKSQMIQMIRQFSVV